MTLPRALFVSLRPHQWTKNLVVLAALAFSKHLFDGEAVVRAGFAFVVFCVLSGAVYLINDLRDLEQDRLHPRKRTRPLASGALPPRAARTAAAVLLLGGLGGALALGPGFAAAALAYVALNLAYSFGLKNVVILDVLAISLGFVLRAVAGALAIDVRFSSWLLVCTILLALFLSLAKRRHELVLLCDGQQALCQAREVPQDGFGLAAVGVETSVVEIRRGEARVECGKKAVGAVVEALSRDVHVVGIEHAVNEARDHPAGGELGAAFDDGA